MIDRFKTIYCENVRKIADHKTGVDRRLCGGARVASLTHFSQRLLLEEWWLKSLGSHQEPQQTINGNFPYTRCSTRTHTHTLTHQGNIYMLYFTLTHSTCDIRREKVWLWCVWFFLKHRRFGCSAFGCIYRPAFDADWGEFRWCDDIGFWLRVYCWICWNIRSIWRWASSVYGILHEREWLTRCGALCIVSGCQCDR